MFFRVQTLPNVPKRRRGGFDFSPNPRIVEAHGAAAAAIEADGVRPHGALIVTKLDETSARAHLADHPEEASGPAPAIGDAAEVVASLAEKLDAALTRIADLEARLARGKGPAPKSDARGSGGPVRLGGAAEKSDGFDDDKPST